MSELRERRLAFNRTLVQHGIDHPMQLKHALPLGSDVPPEKLESWLYKFTRVKGMEFPEQARNVNRFKVGADPEFVFATEQRDPDSGEGGRVEATRLGLKQGLAFGADNNGRLAEIRPHPSRSALETCASVMSTLKWLALTNRSSLQYRWLAGAYLFSDGIGGHVHFGRKRPDRDVEIRALDAMSNLLTSFDVYPQREIAARRRGDAHNQRYGMPGDFRLQTHGYEYRTFPSWLDSPELAFLTLTVSKLVVQDPKLVLSMEVSNDSARRWRQMMNFLAFYKGMDDDARMAFLMCQRALPRHQGGDFKARWGINTRMIDGPSAVNIIPPSIMADKQGMRVLFDKIVNGKEIPWYVPEPTWGPTKLPDGYVTCIRYTETYGAKGLGELIARMCCVQNKEVIFQSDRERYPMIRVGRDLSKYFPVGWQNKYPGIIENGAGMYVYLSPGLREGSEARKTRDLLLSGLFPIWDVRKVEVDSYQKWLEARKVPPAKKQKHVSTVVMEERGGPAQLDLHDF